MQRDSSVHCIRPEYNGKHSFCSTWNANCARNGANGKCFINEVVVHIYFKGSQGIYSAKLYIYFYSSL